VRIEHLTDAEEDEWRAEFGRENWLLGSLSLNVTLPEFAQGRPKLESMRFGYYLQPLHLTVYGREEVPRKLVHTLARRKPPLDFLELLGAGIHVPHCFPPGFSIHSVLRIILLELKQIPVE
jgi:hypothetical protein